MYLDDSIKIINDNKCDKEIYEYLKEKLKNLEIEITSKYKASNIFELMNKGALEGWCWQTTESSILFFNEEDYIQRGYLRTDDNLNYYHSWIVFNYKDNKYIFDPCLRIITDYELYHDVFDIKVLANIKSSDVKEYVINYIKEHQKKEKTDGFFKKYINSLLPLETVCRLEKEIVLHGKEDVNNPIYRNESGFIIEENNGNILSLKVHYYYIDA